MLQFPLKKGVVMESIKILNYQGNKTALLEFIGSNLEKYISPNDIICDIFSGSGSVGKYLAKNHTVIANDIELYSSIISSALLNTPSKSILFESKKEFLNNYNYNYLKLSSNYEKIINNENKLLHEKNNVELSSLYSSFPTIFNGISEDINVTNLKNNNDYNLFLYYFSGTYFGIKQSIQIDTIAKTIHEFKLTEVKDVFWSCLYYAMAECVFSKDGHMAQPLNIEKNPKRHIKQRSKSIITYMLEKLDEFIASAKTENYHKKNKVYNKDLIALLKDPYFNDENIKLIYADPPYTDMQYSRYYHLLNVVTQYDYPNPTINKGKYTKGLYTEGRNQSGLSQKNSAKIILEELFKYCNNKKSLLALSFAYPKNLKTQKTDRYTISIEELVNLAKDVFGPKKVQIERINYKHSNHRNSVAKEVYEYLIICGKEVPNTGFDIIKLKSEIKELIPTSNNPVYNSHLYWSQKSYNVIDLLINNLSNPGDIVFDPFMGSGVTILESVKNGIDRIGIGCDVNEMPKFIVNSILQYIPNSDLNNIFSNFSKKLESLKKYYRTKCPKCSNDATISKIVFDKPERCGNKYFIKAISYSCPICGRGNKTPDQEDYHNLTYKKKKTTVENTKLIQNSKIAVGKNDTISVLFTPRNFNVLDDIVNIINNSNDEEKNVLNYLLMSIIHLSKITDMHSNSQWPLWIPKTNCVEKNILIAINKKMKILLETKKYTEKMYPSSKIICHFSELKKNNALILTKGSQFITSNEVPDDSVSLIITDPPYMDQVMYSEYMQLYKPFIKLNFNLEDEIIVSNAISRKRNKDEYFNLLDQVFYMCSKKLKENHYMCLFFHDSNLDVWAKLIKIMEKNGFRFISQEHIKKSKTVKNILSPKKSLSGDAILFFENTRKPLPYSDTSMTPEEIEHNVYLQAKKMLETSGDLSTPELYDSGIMEMLIENNWLFKLSNKYKTLVDIFENHFIWKREIGKWHTE